MKFMKCSETYVESMCSMPSSSKEQNQSLKKKMKEGLCLDKCFINVDQDRVVCRAIVYEDIHFVGYITVEEIPQEDVNTFIRNVCEQLDPSSEWTSDLYSDKVHFESIRNALQTYFDFEIKRESFTCICAHQDMSRYNFQSAMSFSKEDVLQLMMRATSSTLDTLLQRDQKNNGLHTCVEDMYNEMLERTNESLFQILLVDNSAVGFVIVMQLSKDVGGIGYIGVDPAYQGNQYGNVLLQKAQEIAKSKGMQKLIGDIDTQNYAIRNHLQATGFTKDCDQHVFTRMKR